MRIGTRLWIYVVAASFGVLLVATTLRLGDERDMLEQSTIEDRRFFGAALAATLEAGHITSTEQVRDAFAHGLRAHGEQVETAVRPAPAGAEPSAQARGRGIVTEIPFEHDGQHSVLSLVERVAPQRSIERRSVLHSIGSMAALGAVQMLIVWVLAGRLVSAPLARFGAGARRIAAGDLSERLLLRGDDELATFAREFNAMADALARARADIEERDSARAVLLEQLRHGERLRMVGMLSSSLAHELGTPLGIIAIQANLIDRGERNTQATQRGRAQAISEQVARMKAILQNMLGFARRRPPLRGEHDLSRVAEHAVVMLEPMARKHGVQMRVEAEGGVLVSADETQLLQALTNLMVNAFHAMPRGGEVTVEARRVLGAGGRQWARLAVRDQGTGIAPEVRAHLFDPFFTTKQSEGTGLGLTVTAGIVADHGGSIEVQSESGHGSLFVILLPLAGVEEAPANGEETACA